MPSVVVAAVVVILAVLLLPLVRMAGLAVALAVLMRREVHREVLVPLVKGTMVVIQDHPQRRERAAGAQMRSGFQLLARMGAMAATE